MRDNFQVTLQVRAKNTAILEACRKMGSAAALARHIGVPPVDVGYWLSMKKAPNFKARAGSRWSNPEWVAETERKLFELTGKTLDQIFPEMIRSEAFLAIPKTREITGGVALAGIAQDFNARLRLPAPSDEVEHADTAEHEATLLRKAVESLSERSREIIKARFGLFDTPMLSLRELSKKLGITVERTRQLESKAIMQLRGALVGVGMSSIDFEANRTEEKREMPENKTRQRGADERRDDD